MLVIAVDGLRDDVGADSGELAAIVGSSGVPHFIEKVR